MSKDLAQLRGDYILALAAYLRNGDEASLSEAYSLGRRAMNDGFGVLDMADLQVSAMQALIVQAPYDHATPAVAAANFFRELLSPFEMSHLGYRAENNELRRLNEAILQQKELELESRRAQESSRLKSEFLANMSHELRTPLNSIIGFTELLHDGLVRSGMPQYEEFLSYILTSGRHLLQLINDVLDLSKVEAGKLEFRADSVDLNRVVGEVVASFRKIADENAIRVETQIDPGLVDVVIDASRLKQVLYNYISNAVKFTPREGRVTVRARPDGPAGVVFEVEDTGIGIAESDIGRLFSEFRQLDSSAAKKHPGTGLGLALTKRLVEAQGGTVGVRSTPGQGSTFRAILPRNGRGKGQMPLPKVLGNAPGAAVILVVEHDEADQTQITRLLTGAGYTVETAATGTRAIVRCRERMFDAITIELLLPDLSGVDVLRAIRQEGRNRDIPAILVAPRAEAKAMAGFADVLAKPLDGAQLLASMTRAGVPSIRPGCVLVVDDDPGDRKLMGIALEQLGYRATCVGQGAEGLRLAAKSNPIAVILDLLMPDISGFEFLEQLRKLAPCRNIPVIIWTARQLSREEQDRLRASAQGILEKFRGIGPDVIEELRVFLRAREGSLIAVRGG
jgi:signal transduction histidine kinase/DNA-binding response OmpR family regulator